MKIGRGDDENQPIVSWSVGEMLCLKLLPQFSSHLSNPYGLKICMTSGIRFLIYAIFNLFYIIYIIAITCDKAGIGAILMGHHNQFKL